MYGVCKAVSSHFCVFFLLHLSAKLQTFVLTVNDAKLVFHTFFRALVQFYLWLCWPLCADSAIWWWSWLVRAYVNSEGFVTCTQAEAASTSTQPIQPSSWSEVSDLRVWCLTESWDHSRCNTEKDRKSHFCPWNSSYSPLSTDRPALHQTALDSDLHTPLMPPQWLRMKRQACKHKNTTHIDAVVIKEQLTHWNQQDCDMLGSGGPGSSDKEWGKGRCPCICTDPDWGCKAEEQAVIKIQQIPTGSLMANETRGPSLSPYQTSQRAWHWADESCRWLSAHLEPETS